MVEHGRGEVVHRPVPLASERDVVVGPGRGVGADLQAGVGEPGDGGAVALPPQHGLLRGRRAARHFQELEDKVRQGRITPAAAAEELSRLAGIKDAE